MDLLIRKYGATWCNPCSQQDEEFTKIPLLSKLENIDIDTLSEDETEKLSISSIPTIIALEGNKEICRWVGFTESNTINEYISNYERSRSEHNG